jgi:hypothetical protein
VKSGVVRERRAECRESGEGVQREREQREREEQSREQNHNPQLKLWDKPNCASGKTPLNPQF